ncbi:hypothetical protein HMPREF1475_01473 [Hoylesella oralis HGA0225]|nr:hypothetical protein HMPREF1475_01473 [Hoylesella oralis HGA0225]SHF41226.1 hypothetical protein SAMN05444288_0500 [Hoylesella oralis]
MDKMFLNKQIKNHYLFSVNIVFKRLNIRTRVIKVSVRGLYNRNLKKWKIGRS